MTSRAAFVLFIRVLNPVARQAAQEIACCRSANKALDIPMPAQDAPTPLVLDPVARQGAPPTCLCCRARKLFDTPMPTLDALTLGPHPSHTAGRPDSSLCRKCTYMIFLCRHWTSENEHTPGPRANCTAGRPGSCPLPGCIFLFPPMPTLDAHTPGPQSSRTAIRPGTACAASPGRSSSRCPATPGSWWGPAPRAPGTAQSSGRSCSAAGSGRPRRRVSVAAHCAGRPFPKARRALTLELS